jgi:protein-S-isoprenylcysteine O-methyltransferase Ste14
MPIGTSPVSASESAHTRFWQIGEVVFGVPFLLSIVLAFAVPISLPAGGFTLPRIVLGGLLVLAGMATVMASRRELARRAQPTDPGKPTTALVRTGVFSVSRNPMYLGAVVFLIGVALVADLGWELALMVPSILLCHVVLIAPEESYLEREFGAAYLEYRRSVRRWIGRKRS